MLPQPLGSGPCHHCPGLPTAGLRSPESVLKQGAQHHAHVAGGATEVRRGGDWAQSPPALKPESPAAVWGLLPVPLAAPRTLPRPSVLLCAVTRVPSSPAAWTLSACASDLPPQPLHTPLLERLCAHFPPVSPVSLLESVSGSVSLPLLSLSAHCPSPHLSVPDNLFL